MQYVTSKYAVTYDQSGVSVLYSDEVLDTNYTYTSGDTVYHWEGGQFRMLFDFGAQVGDTWMISTDGAFTGINGCSDSSYVVVTGAGMEMINGIDYRFIELAPVNGSSLGLFGRYNERYGGGSFLFPTGNVCDSNIIVEYPLFGFRCFSDDSLSVGTNIDCEYEKEHLGIDVIDNNTLSVFPNPVKDILHVTSEIGIDYISLFGADGKSVFYKSTVGNEVEFSLKGIRAGMYIMHVGLTNGELEIHRINVIGK